MFEPENDIERMPMRAATKPAARPAVARALMDTQIYTVLVRPLVPGSDGKVTGPAGIRLGMQAATRGKEKLIAFFTGPPRARAWFESEHIVAPDMMCQRGQGPAHRTFWRRATDRDHREAGAGAARAPQGDPDRSDRGPGARARPQFGPHRLSDARGAQRKIRAGLDARRPSQPCWEDVAYRNLRHRRQARLFPKSSSNRDTP